MKEYRRGADTVFEIHLHSVWITKYRRPVLRGAVGLRLRELIRQICGNSEVTIIKGQVAKDHVQLFVSLPPQVAISKLMQMLKGKSSYKLMHQYSHLRKQFWGSPICGRAVTFAFQAAT